MAKKVKQVRGKEIRLSGGRRVFASHVKGGYLVEFTSKEKSITRLFLSEEGMHALCALVLSPSGGVPHSHEFSIGDVYRDASTESKWQLVPEQEA